MWKWGHPSQDTHQLNMFPRYWKMELSDEILFSDTIFKMIEEATGDKLKLRHVYAGGNTYGTSGDIHTDHDRDDARTFLYHASPDTWMPQWGGKTIWYPESEKPIYHEFTPNCGLYFNSTIPHMGEPTTRYFEGLRICLAFKLYVL